MARNPDDETVQEREQRFDVLDWESTAEPNWQETPGKGAPRCPSCFAAWGQCEHTGGPIVPLAPGVAQDVRY